MARKSVLQLVKMSPRPAQLANATRDESKSILDEAGEEGVKLYSEIVSDWDNKPGFKIQVGSGTKVQYMRIFPTGSSKVKTIFYSVDRGTKKRSIKAKDKRFLSFKWGGAGSYKGRTTAVPTWGNAVSISNPTLFRMKETRATHSIKARQFHRVIEPDLKSSTFRSINNAVRRIGRKLGLRV